MSYPYFQNDGSQEVGMYYANQAFGLGYSMSGYYSGNGRYFNPEGSYNFGAMRNKAWTYINNYNTGARIDMYGGNAYTTIFNIQSSIGRGATIAGMNYGSRVWIRNFNTAVGSGGTGGSGYPNAGQGGTNGQAPITLSTLCSQLIINTQGYTWIGGGGGGGGGNGGRRRTGSLPISPNNSSGGGGGGGGGGWGYGGGRPNAYYQGGSGSNGNQVYGGAGGGNGGNAQDGFYGGNWGAAGTYGWAPGGVYDGSVQGYQFY